MAGAKTLQKSPRRKISLWYLYRTFYNSCDMNE